MDFNRRNFLKGGLLSATALALSACGRPVEHGVVSQYHMPEYQVPGQPVFWASTCTELRADCAVSVKTVENRAIQVAGTPGHFFSRGAVNSAAISSLQVLYHPGRLNAATGIKEDQDAGEVVGKAMKKAGSDSLYIVERLCGSAGDAIVKMAEATGGKIWVCDSQQSMRERRILKAVTGRAELPLNPLEKHDLVVTVGSNLLCENYAPARTGWSYGRFRKTPGRLRGGMVSFSTRMNANDANADAWFPVSPDSEPWVIAALGSIISKAKGKGGWPSWADVSAREAADKTGGEHMTHDLENLAHRLMEAKSPLVVGGFQGANGDATVYLAHKLTQLLNGDVATFEPDNLVGEKTSADLFVTDQEAADMLGSCKAVLVNGVDVVYRFPWLAESFGKVKDSIVLSAMPSDTTAVAKKVVPVRSWLEDWGDLMVTSPDGNWYGTMQPAVAKQAEKAESVLKVLVGAARAAGATVRNDATNPKKYLQGDWSDKEFEDLLVRGGHWAEVPDAIYPHRANFPPPATENLGPVPSGYSPFGGLASLEVSSLGSPSSGKVFVTLPTHLGDGHMANRSWMQELPDAMTTVVWDSWIEINEETAQAAGIERHDLVTLKVGGKEIRGSAYPSPFIHPSAIGVPTGRGQKTAPHAEEIELGWESDGSNPKELLTGASTESGYFQSVAAGAAVDKASGSKLLATFDKRVYNLPRHILPE